MVWHKFIESAGNHLLALDENFLQQLQPFYKKTFRIEMNEPKLALDLRPCPDGFIVEPATETPADVYMQGSLLAFIQLAKDGAHSDVFSSGRITMSGDAELGQAFQSVLSRLQIDWEELSASIIGDLAARNVHRALEGLGDWLKQSGDYFRINTGEFLQQEIKLTPSALEVESLSNAIEMLRADTARLEARIARLLANNATAKRIDNA